MANQCYIYALSIYRHLIVVYLSVWIRLFGFLQNQTKLQNSIYYIYRYSMLHTLYFYKKLYATHICEGIVRESSPGQVLSTGRPHQVRPVRLSPPGNEHIQ